MFDISEFQEEGDKLRAKFGQILGIDFTAEVAFKLYEAALGPVGMGLYRVMTFYGSEVDRCRSANAYFSACLTIASSIEALLALMCLNSERQVTPTKIFSTLNGSTYEDKILNATFDKFIQLASTLEWVPSDAVTPEVLDAAIKDVPLVLNNLYPKLTLEEKKRKYEAFCSDPGIEMLRFLQHLRNLVHSNRWPRMGLTLQSDEFESDCKFVFVIAYQVMQCLFTGFSRQASSRAADLESIMKKLTPEGQDLLRTITLDSAGR